MVLPSNTVVAFRVIVVTFQFESSERIWQLRVTGEDQPCSSRMLTPMSTASR